MISFAVGFGLGLAIGYVFRERIQGFVTMVVTFIDRFDKED